MAWLGYCKKPTILFQRWFIYIIPRVILKNMAIGRARNIGICKHSPHFSLRAKVITLIVSSIRTIERIQSTMNRTLVALCRRYIEHKDFTLAYNSDPHIFLLKQTYIDCIFISHTTPKIFLQLIYISI